MSGPKKTDQDITGFYGTLVPQTGLIHMQSALWEANMSGNEFNTLV